MFGYGKARCRGVYGEQIRSRVDEYGEQIRSRVDEYGEQIRSRVD